MLLLLFTLLPLTNITCMGHVLFHGLHEQKNTASKETSRYATCNKAFIYSALPKHMEASRWEKGKKITKRGPALLLYSPSSNWLLAA